MPMSQTGVLKNLTLSRPIILTSATLCAVTKDHHASRLQRFRQTVSQFLAPHHNKDICSVAKHKRHASTRKEARREVGLLSVLEASTWVYRVPRFACVLILNPLVARRDVFAITNPHFCFCTDVRTQRKL